MNQQSTFRAGNAAPDRSTPSEGVTGDAVVLPFQVDVLRQHSIVFAAMDGAAIADLLSHARLIEVAARQGIFQAGEPGDSLYVILAGKVKVSLYSHDGKEAILSLMGVGGVFGEMSLLDGQPRSAAVSALETCRLLQISRSDFLAFLRGHQEVSLKLLTELCQRLRATNGMVENLSFHNLAARLAKLLIDLGQQHGRAEPDGVRIRLRLSQEEIGNLVGASRESVNKQLRAWVESGWVEYQHSTMVLKNVEALFMHTVGRND